MEDRSGQQVGNYRLGKLLGKGGFAEVYVGEHIHLGTLAAIKLLTAKLSDEEGDHFRDEARTIARLKHPNIVRVLEFGIQDGLPYLVMDYAPNGTLRQRFLKGWQLDPQTILPYVQQVAGALQFAHDRKVIHRDVKPENMLLGENGEVLLSDFGIAVVAQSSRHQDVQEVVGTLAYMAPEQIQAHPRPASDQYSLGVVIYEWLTGARPFYGSMSEILAKQISMPPAPLREKIPNVSRELEQVILTSLAKDPKDRFASMRAFLKAFEQACFGASSGFPAAPTPGAYPANAWGGQGGNISSAPAIPSGSTTSSPQGTTSGPSGTATPSSTPYYSASPAPYPNANSANLPTYVAPAEASATPPALASSAPQSAPVASDPFIPSGPKQTPPASADSDIFSAPTIMGTFLTPTAPQEAAQAGSPAAALPPQPVTFLPPGWQTPQPEISSGPLQTGPTLLSSGPAGGIVQPGVSPAPGPSWTPPSRGVSRRKVLIGGFAGLAGLAVIGGGITWLVTSKNTPVQTIHPTPTTPGERPLYTYRGHKGAVRDIAWSIDGNRIATAGADHTVQIWDALTGEDSFLFHGHTGVVRALTFSPDKQFLASASDDKTVQILNLTSKTRTFLYQGHTDAVLAVAWAPAGKNIASGGLDQTVQIWSTASDRKPLIELNLSGSNNHATSVAWSPNGQYIAATSTDGTIRIWDATTKKLEVTYRGHTAGVNSVAWSPDGSRLISGSSDKRAIIWDAITGKTYAKDHSHDSAVDSVAWSPNGKYIATASTDATVQILDAATYQLLRTYSGHNGPVLAIAWSPDSQYIASAGQDGTAQVWKASVGA